MKVLFLTEGGVDKGLGHLTRCIALAQSFSEREKIPEISFLVSGGEDAQDFLGKEGSYQTSFFDWSVNVNECLGEVSKNDVIVIDSYAASENTYEKISNAAGNRCLMLDDYNRIKYPRGVVVNPAVNGDDFEYPREEGIVYFLGKEYVILREPFWNVTQKVLKEKITNVLLTFGGIDNKQFTEELVRHLKSKYSFDVNVIQTQANTISANDMIDGMLNADLCISGGGQTTYELARVGVPTIGICFSESQIGNLEKLSELGLVEFAGWNNDPHLLQKVEDLIGEISPLEKRETVSSSSRSLIDGHGGRRVIEKFLDYCKAINKG